LVRLCSVENCPNRHFGKGFCPQHYQKWRRYGNPIYVFDPEKRRKNHSKAMKGRKYSEEHKKKISEAHKGKKLSEKHKKKLSEAHKNLSAESRKNMSEAAKGKIVSEATKKKISDYQNRPEILEKNRQQLRNTRHNQVKPNKRESQIGQILTEAEIRFKFHHNVDYQTIENEHRKKEVDIFIRPKKIIEHNGTYNHADPRKYKPDDLIREHGKMVKASEIWKREKIILNQIKKQGYKILVIWEQDLLKDTENTKNKILKFAKS